MNTSADSHTYTFPRFQIHFVLTLLCIFLTFHPKLKSNTYQQISKVERNHYLIEYKCSFPSCPRLVDVNNFVHLFLIICLQTLGKKKFDQLNFPKIFTHTL